MLLSQNKKKSKLPLFHVFATVFSIFLMNYLSITGVDTKLLLIPFVLFHFLLFSLNPLCAFVFCFVMNVNLMQNSMALWLKPLMVICSFSTFIFNFKLFNILFKNRKLRTIFYCSILFSFFVLVTNYWNNVDLNSSFIFEHFNTLFGLLIFLPSYYFASRQAENLFLILSVIAAFFLIVYFYSLVFNLNLFKIGEIDATIESDLTRYAGYDLRQFIIFFIFLIPAFLLTKAVSVITKFSIISIGVLAYLVLILGIYRLALFYNFMGLLLSLYFIGKHIKVSQLLRRFIFLAIFICFVMYFFSEYIMEFQKVFIGTYEYFTGKGEDGSADERFVNQTPILLAYIYNNFWTGCGLIESTIMTRNQMYGFVDFPILGSLAKFGFIGMFIYYIRYYFILRNENKLTVKYFSYYNEKQKLLFFIYLTIKAYIITLITFRLFYISWELAFDWQQLEFGLFIGIYLALERLIIKNENSIFQNLKCQNV